VSSHQAVSHQAGGHGSDLSVELRPGGGPAYGSRLDNRSGVRAPSRLIRDKLGHIGEGRPRRDGGGLQLLHA
jgi:hypothetical protein